MMSSFFRLLSVLAAALLVSACQGNASSQPTPVVAPQAQPADPYAELQETLAAGKLEQAEQVAHRADVVDPQLRRIGHPRQRPIEQRTGAGAEELRRDEQPVLIHQPQPGEGAGQTRAGLHQH